MCCCITINFPVLGGDQGLLNTFFSDWAVKDIHKHLPFIYNLSANAIYTYLPAFHKYVFINRTSQQDHSFVDNYM